MHHHDRCACNLPLLECIWHKAIQPCLQVSGIQTSYSRGKGGRRRCQSFRRPGMGNIFAVRLNRSLSRQGNQAHHCQKHHQFKNNPHILPPCADRCSLSRQRPSDHFRSSEESHPNQSIMILIRKLSTGIFIAVGHAVWAARAPQRHARHSVAEWTNSQGDERPTDLMSSRIGSSSTTFATGGICLYLLCIRFPVFSISHHQIGSPQRAPRISLKI